MKKELFAGLLLAVLLALSVWNTASIKSLCGSIGDLVDRSAQAAAREDWEESRALLDRAMELWKSRQGYTGIVLRHTDIETLTGDFYELAEHIYTRDAPAANAASALVREHLASITKMESLNWESIF